MESRINQATGMLTDFLDHELSETYLGIPTGARAHLERFRSFLLSFYTSQIGYYPPSSFEPDLFTDMRDDFRALYELLVDDAYTASEIMPSVAAGGICTLQLIQSFDSRHRYDPLNHPLPLLPEFVQRGLSRKLPFLSRSDKIKPEQRFLAHASLIKASNWRETIFKNRLVRAYRQFEELSVVAPHKTDKLEAVSLMDARKMRWILVYSTYQVLRSVTGTPSEVPEEHKVPYHMAIGTDNLPPWEARKEAHEIRRLLRTQTDLATVETTSPYVWNDSGLESDDGKIELKPDIDYYTLTHPPAQPERRGPVPVLHTLDTAPPVPDRTSSLSRAMSRSSTIRKSMRRFMPAPPSPTLQSQSSYHEIVVHGYGNGTNGVTLSDEEAEGEAETDPGVSRSDSTSATSDAGAESGPESLDSSADTADSGDSPVTLDSPMTFPEIQVKPLRPKRRDVVSMMMPSLSRPASNPRLRPVSTICEASSYSDPYTQLVEEEEKNIFGDEGPPPPPPARSIHRHSTMKSDLRRWSFASSVAAPKTPVRIHGGDEEEWAAMQAFMDGGDGRVEVVDEDTKPAWDQYADMGGLTEARWI